MSDSKFSFKQFELHQELCAMKVGTDSVLLGAWANIPAQGYILDIGAGTGILSLMAAQRSTNTYITAIEIDTPAAQQARENIARSNWAHRIEVINGDFTQITDRFDHPFNAIISNPPYIPTADLAGLMREVQFEPTMALDQETADRTALQIARYAWDRRKDFAVPVNSAEKAFDLALMVPDGPMPVVINESSDNTGGGAPGDGTHLLREMLECAQGYCRMNCPIHIFVTGEKALENMV